MNPLSSLTPRQQRVAELVRDGWTDKAIAAEMGISRNRVRAIIARIATLWELDHSLNIRVQITRCSA